ncbi:MAG: hypothetical protein B7X06_02020 [Verrucomicrobia bacterium 21-51-4]|nr:MAG: hypothetical protein B7X06_02020 [Verrucomicrobia bacterium 21-51-4]
MSPPYLETPPSPLTLGAQLQNFSQEIWEFLSAFVMPHMLTVSGFALALLVVARIFNEKRSPSNIFAWSLLIFFVPYFGVPLYFLFGGRKSRRLAENKRKIRALAQSLSDITTIRSPTPALWPQIQAQEGQHRFEFFPDGVRAFDALLSEIAHARESIHLMTFIMGKDAVATRVRDALVKRAREGLEVKLLVDAIGSFGHAGHFLKPLREAGAKVARFMPMIPLMTQTSANLRNHRKVAIFDRSRAFVGGQNIDNRFMGPRPDPKRFIDFSALIQGPAVSHFNVMFVSDWCFASGEKPESFRKTLCTMPASAGSHNVKVLSSGPDVEGDPLWESLITMIQECQRELTIVTPYFLPDEVLFQSLIVKAHTGRRIRLIIPEVSNHRMVDFARNHYLRLLKQAGVQILLYTPAMLHAKLFIVDDHIAMFGSANLDMRSLFVNFEVGVFMFDHGSISTLQNWVDTLLPDCIGYEQYAAAKSTSSNRRLIEDFAYLLGPML